MIDVINEQMIPFSKVPSWCEKNIGNRPHRSTVHRWRLRGARGVKLETILVGGRRFTSREALLRFFDDSTAAESGPPIGHQLDSRRRREIEKAEAYLKSEGI
ncbi:DUF1580 domain-containing protein [Mariniblastus sp.]|nr:DUF1580 domain-containing protein [Mariniblastus sp.]